MKLSINVNVKNGQFVFVLLVINISDSKLTQAKTVKGLTRDVFGVSHARKGSSLPLSSLGKYIEGQAKKGRMKKFLFQKR